jgi:hypothetical protein
MQDPAVARWLSYYPAVDRLNARANEQMLVIVNRA